MFYHLDYKIGEVPRYLSERKQEIKKQHEIVRNEDPHCPDGHFVLSDEDRLKSLGMAENSNIQKQMNYYETIINLSQFQNINF